MHPEVIALLLLTLLFSGYILADTWSGLLSLWWVLDGNLGHGFLVALTSLYLAWRALGREPSVALSPDWYSFIPLFICSVLLVMAGIVGIELLQYLLLPLIILLSFALVAGRDHARRIIVPVGLLYFAIPIWDHLNNLLLAITTVVTQVLVQHTGITAHITGNSIFIPSGEVIIASGCSGLRYFIVGTFLGVVSNYLNFISWKRGLLLMLMVITLSLAANWVRVYGITLIAYYSEMQSPLVDDHELLGWVVFMLFMAPLFYLNSRYAAVDIPGIPANTSGKRADEPRVHTRTREAVNTGMALVLLWVGIASAPWLLNRYAAMETSPMTVNDLATTFNIGSTEMSVADTDGWHPRITVPAAAGIRRYGEGMDAVSVHRYLYTRGPEQGQFVPYINNIHDRDHWAVRETRNVNTYKQLRLVHKITQDEILVAYRFDVGSFITTSYLLAKLYQFPAVVTRRPYALFTAVSTPCLKDCDAAHARLVRYINDL